MMKEFIIENEIQGELIKHSMAAEGESLFECLKEQNLLDWNLFKLDMDIVRHIPAMKWCLENGIDVVNDKNRFEQIAYFAPAKVIEYLIVEKGLTVTYFSKLRDLDVDILKMIYKVKGFEELQNIDDIELEFEMQNVQFLRSVGFEFHKRVILEAKPVSSYEWYALVCCSVLKYEDLDVKQKESFHSYLSENDVKASKHLFPFMKEIRKKKIMTVMLCIRTLYPFFQKEIIWNILDLTYSPIKERGSL